MANISTSDTVDAEYAKDVNHALALIVFWPYGAIEYRHLGDDLEAEIRDAVVQELRDHLAGSDIDRITVSRYQIGPTAEWFPTYLLTIFRDIQPIITTGADLIEWAGLITIAGKAIRGWASRARDQLPTDATAESPRGFAQPLLSVPAIEALCYRHFRETHHPRAAVSISTSVRMHYEPYGSHEHPSGHERYTIQLETRHKMYVYLVDACGNPIEHYRVTPKGLISLPLPNWFGDPRRLSDETNHVGTIEIPRGVSE